MATPLEEVKVEAQNAPPVLNAGAVLPSGLLSAGLTGGDLVVHVVRLLFTGENLADVPVTRLPVFSLADLGAVLDQSTAHTVSQILPASRTGAETETGTGRRLCIKLRRAFAGDSQFTETVCTVRIRK